GNVNHPTEEFSPLGYLNDKYDIKSMDRLILTHPHKDHLDDIFNLSLVWPSILTANRSIAEGYVRDGNEDSASDIIDEYYSLLGRYTGPVDSTEAETNESTWGCYLRTFLPDYDGSNLNNYSVVTVLKYAGTKIVIPGDNEGPSWKALLNRES